MTYEKIKSLQLSGTKWSDNKQLSSLIYQKQNLNIEELETLMDNEHLDGNDKAQEGNGLEEDEMDLDDINNKSPTSLHIDRILFKEVFKLYDSLIIEEYLSDIHTVSNLLTKIKITISYPYSFNP